MSEVAAKNLQNTFQGTTIGDRPLLLRQARPFDEHIYEVDQLIRSGEMHI